jgi:hypothetical protein
MWRAATGDPYPMEKNPDEIPMFARFAERGLSLPASDFFKGLMGYYGIEYLHWILFRKFFRVKPQPSASNLRVVGGAGIQMREDAAEQYLSYKLIDSNQDWKPSGSTSQITTHSCRSRAGSSPSIVRGGTPSRRCRKGSSCPSCWCGSRR